MKILALETSGFGGSACVASEGVTLAEQGIPSSMRSAKGLAPTIARTLVPQIGPQETSDGRYRLTIRRRGRYRAGVVTRAQRREEILRTAVERIATGLKPLRMDGHDLLLLLIVLGFNILLAAFNLLPVPPLDGGRVLANGLPQGPAARFLERIEPFGLMIVVLLLVTGIAERFVVPLADMLESAVQAGADAFVVADHLASAMRDERFDLVIATNILIYYDVFEQSLALSNIARMLRPGGWLLTNTPLFELPEIPMRAAGETQVSYTPGGNDWVVWYRRE